MAPTSPPSLSDQVRECVEHYLHQPHEEEPQNIYHVVLEAIEGPVLESVLRFTQGNTSRASRIMGIGRNTLIKKIKLYKEKGYLKDF